MRTLRLVFWISLALAPPGTIRGQDFSSAPVAAPVAFPPSSLPADAPAFLDWLAAQAAPASLENVQQIREHLYALIAQIVKQRFTTNGSTDLVNEDTALARLFAWGDRLGVPGAGEVAKALGENIAVPATPLPSGDFELTLMESSFSLISVKGRWMVRFPYYFMPGMLGRRQLNNGLENDLAVLSTLTAANSAPTGGASQATILFASAQTPDLADYTVFWLGQLQMTPSDTAPRPVPQAMRNYRRFDPASGLWKEVVVFEIPSGSLIAAYIGLDGTYQANRPHFLDLLASLRVSD